jgi:hypothetical protein
MVSPKPDPGRTPAPVAESWRRIEAWLAEHLPDVKASLRPGISKDDLAKFEDETGLRLPDDVRESWEIHDGQAPIPWSPESPDHFDEDNGCDEDEIDPEEGPPLSDGVIFGLGLLPLTDAGASWAAKSVLSEYRRRTELCDRSGSDEIVNQGCTSSPAGAIRCLSASRG